MLIAPEGMIPVLVTALIAAWLSVTAGWAGGLPAAGVCIYMLALFRDTQREIPARPLAMVSPVDGRIIKVDSVDDPWLERRVSRVRVALHGPGIGVVRSPTEGKVMEFWTRDQPFDAQAPVTGHRASPNCYAVWVRTDEGDDVVLALSSTRPISRFKLDVAPGERVGQGQRHAFVYFATWVDVLLPADARVDAREGSRVQAGSGVLAQLVRS